MLKVLSYGAGIQSTTLLLMSCKGILPKLDCAIFADTGWEPKDVYEHLEWSKIEAAKYDIPVHTTRATEKGIREDMLYNHLESSGSGFISVPLRILNNDGTKGLGRRQCTREYKVTPIDIWMKRNLLGLERGQHSPKEPVIEQWMGISYDEATRAKPSRERWKKHVFPFLSIGCEYLDKEYTRRFECVDWLEENYPDITVPRSACIGCPYRNNEEWRHIKSKPEEWEDACSFDEQMRLPKPDGEVVDQYVHRSYKPLREADLRSEAEKGQSGLWDNECEGMCGM